MRSIIILSTAFVMSSCGGGGIWGPVLEVSPLDCVIGRYDVTVSAGSIEDDPRFITSDIEIDVIALTNDQYCIDGWHKYDLKDYFDINGNSLRDSSPVWKARFNSSDNDPKTLSSDDPIWSVWEGEEATHLVILAKQMNAGTTDSARRLVLPLDRSRWHDENIELRLMKEGLVLQTRRLPPWPDQPIDRFKQY
ncbi:MAG: hypothetical protein VX436_03630 [Planctomycetota bacterium]|nr:hypothetical protein [Planctomycetota bacterium]